MARLGAWLGLARQGVARRGMELGSAWRGMARRGARLGLKNKNPTEAGDIMAKKQQRAPRDPEMLEGMDAIIRYCGFSRRTWYAKRLHEKLKDSRYVYTRPGSYGNTYYWTYKRLLLAFLAEEFPPDAD